MRYIEVITDDELIPYQHSPDHGVISVRRLSEEVRSEIRQRYQKTDFRHGGRIVYIPEDKVLEVERDLWDYIIVRWEGVARYGSTETLPCTRDWKSRLPNDVRQGILALADAANLSGMRSGTEPAEDPTRA
jgi:hypothetical protein